MNGRDLPTFGNTRGAMGGQIVSNRNQNGVVTGGGGGGVVTGGGMIVSGGGSVVTGGGGIVTGGSRPEPHLPTPAPSPRFQRPVQAAPSGGIVIGSSQAPASPAPGVVRGQAPTAHSPVGSAPTPRSEVRHPNPVVSPPVNHQGGGAVVQGGGAVVQGGGSIVTGGGAEVRGGGPTVVVGGGAGVVGGGPGYYGNRHGGGYGGGYGGGGFHAGAGFSAHAEAEAGFVAGARLTLGPSRPPVCWDAGPTVVVGGGSQFGAGVHAGGGAVFSAGITTGSIWNAGCSPNLGYDISPFRENIVLVQGGSYGLTYGQPPINYVTGGADYYGQNYGSTSSWGARGGIVASPGGVCGEANVGGVYHKEFANGLFSITAAWGAAAGPGFPTPGIWTCGLPSRGYGGYGGVIFGGGCDPGIIYGGPQGVILGGPQNVILGGPQNVVLGGPQNVVLGGPQEVVVGGPQNVVLGGPQNLVVGSSAETLVGRTENIKIGSTQSIVYGKNGPAGAAGVEGAVTNDAARTNVVPYSFTPGTSSTVDRPASVPKWNPAGLQPVPTSK